MEKDNDNVESTPMRLIMKSAHYLEFPIAQAETSPLVWWKAECRRFPTLSHLAMKYLCISGTSVPSERRFSSGGHIVNSLRGR